MTEGVHHQAAVARSVVAETAHFLLGNNNYLFVPVPTSAFSKQNLILEMLQKDQITYRFEQTFLIDYFTKRYQSCRLHNSKIKKSNHTAVFSYRDGKKFVASYDFQRKLEGGGYKLFSIIVLSNTNRKN